MIRDMEAATATIIELNKLGISIALDDFGTAYASMEMLKVLPADIIKIEHMFVSNLEEQGHEIDFAIIENILSLSQTAKAV